MRLNQFPDKARFVKMAGTCNVIPLCVEILADMETPVSLLSKFYRDKGPLFLFESVEGGERWGRYSFLGISAKTRVGVFTDHVEIRENGAAERIDHQGDPMAVLKAFMTRYKAAEIPELPRFWGGLVGYFTYEGVCFFENIPNAWPPEKPLAQFMIPDALLIFDNTRHTMMAVVIAFIDAPAGAEKAYDEALNRIQGMLATIAAPLAGEDAPAPEADLALNPVMAQADFRHLVAVVKDHITAGDVIQTVISQPFVCDCPPDLRRLYRAQRYVNPSPYLFFLHLGPTALVGSSPETMVRMENGVATLRPIAGTRPRGRSEQEDRAMADELLQDEKERAEHLMLVDLGRNDLGRVACVGSVQVTDLMVIERYSHVMHLVSNICCDLKPEMDAWDLLRATFPAGTLSGAPKIRAMEIIAELEQTPRGPYGGAVGYVAFNGNMDMAITIRTACIEDGRLTVRAGAGIVADSDPEKERVETVNKAMALQKALQLVQKPMV